MVGILIVSHGRLPEALIASVEFLVGKLRRTRGVSSEREEEYFAEMEFEKKAFIRTYTIIGGFN
jgi:mannose/fructose-specific phosphotransferase system component IIA